MKKFKNSAVWKKAIICFLAALLAIIMVTGAVILALWGNEIASVMSMEHIRERNDAHLDGDVYTMNIKGGFYLDEFVEMGGVKNDTELINFVTEKITKGLINMSISDPDIGCASFTAKTEAGDALFARNYDFSKTNTCIVFTEKNDGRHASVSTVDLQFIGIDVDEGVNGLMDKITCLAATYAPLDGMNDAGVACGIYMTYQGSEGNVTATDQNTDKPDFTSTTLLRLILDYADNVDEAVEIARSYDMHDSAKTSYHYMVADASGKSVILEWIYGTDSTDIDGSKRELVVTYNDNDTHIGETEGNSDYQWITNFIIQPDYYENAEDKKGLDRYEQIYADLSKTNGIVKDEATAMNILATIGRRSWNNDDGNGCTVHSAVYNLTDKTVMWVPNENFGDAVYEYKLGE